MLYSFVITGYVVQTNQNHEYESPHPLVLQVTINNTIDAMVNSKKPDQRLEEEFHRFIQEANSLGNLQIK